MIHKTIPLVLLTDINECDMPEGMECEDICVNHEGSFTCHCSNPGYILSWDRTSCSGIFDFHC